MSFTYGLNDELKQCNASAHGGFKFKGLKSQNA